MKRSCWRRSTGSDSTTTTGASSPMPGALSPREAALAEPRSNPATGRDPYTRFRAAMPTEGPLSEAGLEIWPRGIYDLVTQISREYNHPIIEITESGCGYLDSPDERGR